MRKDMTNEQAIKSVKAERKWFQDELDKPMDESLTSEEIYVSGYYECQATCKNRVDAFNLTISALEKQPKLLAEVEQCEKDKAAKYLEIVRLKAEVERLNISIQDEYKEHAEEYKRMRTTYIREAERLQSETTTLKSERDVALKAADLMADYIATANRDDFDRVSNWYIQQAKENLQK